MRLQALILLVVIILAATAASVSAVAPVRLLTITGQIEPTVADYIKTEVAAAERDKAGAVVIRLDTPGGGMDPMESIVQTLLNSRVPTIVYVGPSGATAASAGTFIAMAANIAAMAPGTNIGSAHPVSLFGSNPQQQGNNKSDDVMTEKIVNHAAKYLSSIAEQRGRNTEWAEKAVRESANLKASEAVKMNVVDFMAKDLGEVLSKADGMTVVTAAGNVVLHTKDAPVEERDMPWNQMLLHFLANPLVTYLLLLTAIYGIIFEINTPGATFPGVIGGISIILLLFSLSVVPINYAGLLLIVLAVILFIADIKVPTHGALTVGGAIAFFLGSLMLFRQPGAAVPILILVAGTLATVVFFAFLVRLGARALRLPVVTGRQGIIGQLTVAKSDIDPVGRVFTEGAWWNAETDGEPIRKGEVVRIVGIEGLKIKVEKTAVSDE